MRHIHELWEHFFRRYNGFCIIFCRLWPCEGTSMDAVCGSTTNNKRSLIKPLIAPTKTSLHSTGDLSKMVYDRDAFNEPFFEYRVNTWSLGYHCLLFSHGVAGSCARKQYFLKTRLLHVQRVPEWVYDQIQVEILYNPRDFETLALY